MFLHRRWEAATTYKKYNVFKQQKYMKNVLLPSCCFTVNGHFFKTLVVAQHITSNKMLSSTPLSLN